MFFAYCQGYVRRSSVPSNGIVQEAYWCTLKQEGSPAPFCFIMYRYVTVGQHDVLAGPSTSDMLFFPENCILLCSL
jgi:hypothetical protein